MPEQLSWVALDCKGVPNKVYIESTIILYNYINLCIPILTDVVCMLFNVPECLIKSVDF